MGRSYCGMCNIPLTCNWMDSFKKCPNCGLIYCNYYNSNQPIDDYYLSSWMEPDENIQATGNTGVYLANQYVHMLAHSLGLKNFYGLKILDFGAGRGSMLNALSNAGAEVWAVEPYGYNYLQEKGYEVFKSISDITLREQFDGIVSLDVIEHLETPWEEISQLRNLLKENGWLFLATPNCGSLNAKITGSKWREAQNPGHLVFFNASSLRKVLINCGYREIKRLNWNVSYTSKLLKRTVHYCLQAAGLDGELRFLAYK